MVIGSSTFTIALSFDLRGNRYIYIIIIFHLVTKILTKTFHLGTVNKIPMKTSLPVAI